MTYDISFLRVLPGRTFDETLEEINSAYDPDADLKPMNRGARRPAPKGHPLGIDGRR
ncbi:hypothetical protein [Streptomyces sp. NPDC058206]|uniref:hypothetical protein n=1 Tax=Streptomyces sp. NPDC058206 TaxID=3346382 RepID=UPI0036E52706